MNKSHGPKTIDISVNEFDGLDLHEPIEPFQPGIIAYREAGREGALSYHADVAGMLLGCSALKRLEGDEEAQFYLADYVAACAWATSWHHMRNRARVARSPRNLPRLGAFAVEVRPDGSEMVQIGTHTLEAASREFIPVLTAAEDATLTTAEILSLEGSAVRTVSRLCGEGALTLACVETVERLKEKPELPCQVVQEELKAAAIDLSPRVREIARDISVLPDFRGLAETDSELSVFFRTNKGVPLIVKRAVAGSREAIQDQFPQIV